jgi:hypothetical protein
VDNVCDRDRVHIVDNVCDRDRVHVVDNVCGRDRVHIVDNACGRDRVHIADDVYDRDSTQWTMIERTVLCVDSFFFMLWMLLKHVEVIIYVKRLWINRTSSLLETGTWNYKIIQAEMGE